MSNIIFICAFFIGITSSTVQIEAAQLYDDQHPFYTIPKAAAEVARSSQETLDRFAAERAKFHYGTLNFSGRFTPCPPKGEFSTPSAMWELTTRDGSIGMSPIQIRTFKVREGIAPTDALIDFYTKGGVIECAIARALVELMITLDLVGIERFNEGFKDELLLPSSVPTFSKTGSGAPRKLGESGYFTNIDSYFMMHPFEPSNGQNVICVELNPVGQPLYLGFGPFFSGPRTAKEIVNKLYEDTISAPLYRSNCDQFNAHVGLLILLFRAQRDQWEEMREQAQVPVRGMRLHR